MGSARKRVPPTVGTCCNWLDAMIPKGARELKNNLNPLRRACCRGCGAASDRARRSAGGLADSATAARERGRAGEEGREER